MFLKCSLIICRSDRLMEVSVQSDHVPAPIPVQKRHTIHTIIYIRIIRAFPVILQLIMSKWLIAPDGVIVERTNLLLYE